MKRKHSSFLCDIRYSRNPVAFIMSPSQQFTSALIPFSAVAGAVNGHPREHGAAPRSVVGAVWVGVRWWRCIKVRLWKNDVSFLSSGFLHCHSALLYAQWQSDAIFHVFQLSNLPNFNTRICFQELIFAICIATVESTTMELNANPVILQRYPASRSLCFDDFAQFVRACWGNNKPQ